MNTLLLIMKACHIIIVILVIIIALILYYLHSRDKGGWFHLLCRLIWDGKFLLLLLLPCIYAMMAYKIDSIKVIVDLPTGWDIALTELSFAIAGGYISGYIIYVLSTLVPKAKRQRPILSFLKNSFWYVKGEIEYRICHENTKDKDAVLRFLKNHPTKNETMQPYEIIAENKHYILEFLSYVSSTLNATMEYGDYLDDNDLDSISIMMIQKNKAYERLKDHEGVAYYDDKELDELAGCISSIYNHITQLHNKLASLV